MYKTQQSYDEMNDDFIQFDSDMSHVDLADLFDLADSITVPEPQVPTPLARRSGTSPTATVMWPSPAAPSRLSVRWRWAGSVP